MLGLKLKLGFMSGSAMPALMLNFISTATLDPRITFSRGTNGMVTDATGKLTYAPNNLLTYSNDFSNAVWTKENATVVQNATAPDGTATAWTLTNNTTNGQHRIYFDLFSTNSSGVRSIFVKAGSADFVGISSSGTDGSVFNLSTGVKVSDYGSAVGSITNLGDGWFRIGGLPQIAYRYLVLTIGETASQAIPGTSYVGTTKTILVYGAQLEAVTYQTTPGTYNSTTPKNLLGYTQEFDNAAWTKSNATVTANATTAPDGSLTADKLVEDTAAAAHGLTSTSVAIVANTPMAWSIYAKAGERSWMWVNAYDGANRRCWFDLANGVVGTTAAGCTASITAIGNGWYRCSVLRAAGVSPITLSAYATTADNTTTYTGDGTSGIYIWGAQLSNSASVDRYVYNPGAALTSAAYYGPRFDYDPTTLAAKGLLIEEARTNLLTYSNDYTQAAWSKAGSTSVTASAATSPDGTSNASYVSIGTTGDYLFQQYSTTSATTAYTFSVWLKSASAQTVRVEVQQSGGGITTTTASVTSTWQRFTATYTTDASPTYVRAQLRTAVGGTLSNLQVYGAQLEAGSFATSYIPTAASSATRNADVATMTGANFSSWYNQTQGTFVAEADTLYATPTSQYVFSVGEVTDASQVYVNINSSSNAIGNVAVTGVSQASLTPTGTISSNASFKFAIATMVNSFAAALNGSVTATDTSGAMPTVDRFTLGNRATGARALNGHIRSISYYNSRLPNTTLQSLST